MNHFLNPQRQNFRIERRQSLPVIITGFSMNRSSSLILGASSIEDEAAEQQQQQRRRKLSAGTLDFSSMNFFSTITFPRSNNLLNVTTTPLAPIKTCGNLTNFERQNQQQQHSATNNQMLQNINHSSVIDIIREEANNDEANETDDDAMNQGFITDDKETDLSNVCNTIRRSFSQRRKSLPTFLSINPTTIATASDKNESKHRRNSIDIARSSQKSLRVKPRKKVNNALNRAFIFDKENDKLEYYDKILLSEDEINMSDVFEEEESGPKYDKILYLPKVVDDKNIDYKKKYQQLQQKYLKREERIADVKKLILEDKSKSEILQRLNGILSCKVLVSSRTESDANDFSEQSRPTSASDTIRDLEKEFEKLKLNIDKEK
uniref:Uncharacterized protein n=1 Tax=Panagrolaimus superbus TaxID=310955 RepID=A0A914Y0F1_9BILA